MTLAGALEAFDARMRAGWRSYLWRRWTGSVADVTLQAAREPGVWTIGLEVRTDCSTAYATARGGPWSLTVGIDA